MNKISARDKVQDIINNVIKQFKTKYKVIGTGRTRIVFEKDENTVFKVPLNDFGMRDNQQEVFRSEKWGKMELNQ